ncbi:MAG TPA: hypothetical protein DIS66_06870, partial [Candidatus Omnitrophica bacterium]|nr:hypothetical protein [Candidatus Omnitrophota bacterium]
VYLAGIALVVGAVQTLTEWWGAGTSNSEKKVGVKEGIRLEVLIPGTPEQILQEKIKPWIYIVLALGYFLVMTVVHAISVGDFLAQGQQKDKTAAMALQVEANLGSRNFSENAKLVSGSIMSVIDQIYPSASEQEKKDLHDLALFQTGMESGLFQYADQKNWKEAGHPSIDIAKGIFQHEVTRSRTLGDHVMTWLGYPSKEGDVRRIDQEFLAKKLELTSQGESQPSYKAIVELREAAIKRFPNDAGLQAEYIARALAYRVMQLDLMDDYELDAFFFFVKEKRVKSRMAKNGDTLRDMAQNLEDGVFNDKYFRTKPSPASKKQEIADAIKDHTFGYGGRQGWNVVLATAVSEPQANTSSRVASVDEILALPKWDSERGFLEESLLFPTLDQPAVARQDLPAVARTPSAVESELVATVPLEVFSSELAQVENQVPSANLSWYQREIALPFAQWAARIAPDGGLPVQVFFAGAVLYLIGALFRAAIFNFKKTPSSYSNMTTAVGRSSMSLALSGSVYAYSVVGVELANKWIGTNILIGRLTTAELVMVIEAPILIFFAMLIFGKIKYGKEFALGRVFAKGFLPREAFAPKPRSEKEVVSARSEARGVAQPLTRREAIRRSLLFAAGIGTGGLVANYGLKQVNIGINSPDLASTTSSGDLFFDLRSWNIEVMRFEDAQNDSDAQIISPANFFLEDKQPTGFLRLQEEEPIVDFNHNLSEKAMAKAMFFIDGTGRPHIFDYQKYAENPELYGVQLYPIGFQAGPWIKIGEDLNLGIEVWHKGLQGGRRVAIGYDRLGRFFFKEFYGPDFMGKMGMSTDSFMTELHAWLSRNSIESAMFVDGGTTGFGVGQKTPPYVIVARSKGRSEMRVADQSPEEIADWVVDLSQGPKNKTEEWSAAGFPGPFSNYPLFMREFPVERFQAVLSVLRARKEYDAGKWFARSMLDSLLGYGMQNTEFLTDLPQYYDYFNLNDANPESEFNKNLDFFERRTAAVQYGVSTALKEQVLKLAFETFGVRRDPNEEYELEPRFDAEGHSFRNQFVHDLNLAFMIALKSAGEKGILWDPALLPFLFQLSNSNSIMRINNGGYAGELDVTVQVSSQKTKLTVERNKNEVLIGRGSSNDLIVQDSSVSRSHLVLRRDKDNSEKFRLIFTGKNRPLLWPDAERSSLDQRRSEIRVFLDSNEYLQTEPVSYDFFNALADANDVSEAAKIVKKEISSVAAELRQLIQQNGFIPNKIGNGERSVFNTQELREKEKIGLNDADLLALLQSDKEEMLALAESYGQEQGHSFTVDKINEKIVDRMVDILAEAIWTYVKRHEAWVEWGRRLQALDSFLDKQEEAELSAAVAVFDVGQFLSSSGEYVFGGYRIGRGILRGQVDVLVDFARQGSVQPQHLRLNFFSIALASLGYFQKGPPSAHSPDQAYPVSPAQFWNDHIKNSRTNLFEHPDTQKFIREISEDEEKAKEVIQKTAQLIQERQLKKSIRDRTWSLIIAGVAAVLVALIAWAIVKKLSVTDLEQPSGWYEAHGEAGSRTVRSEMRAEASEEFISAVENLIGKPISKAETFNLDGETLNLIEAFERLQQAANKWSETESYDLEIQGEPGKNVQIYLLRDGKRLVDLDGLPTFSREYQNLAMGILAEIQRKVRKHKPSTQITITLLEAENDAEIEDYNPSIVEVSLEQPGPRKESLIKLQPKPFKANSKVDGLGILFLNHVGLRTKENTDDANQDRFMNFTVKTKMGQAAVMAVFDGHGKRGAEAAEQAQNLLKLELETILARVDAATSDDDWRAQIESAFQRVSLEMNKKGYLQSGTTASIAVVVGGRIVMISLGDSPIMVVDRSQPQNPISKKSTLNHVGDQNSKTAMDLKLMKSIRADADEIDLISRGWGLNGDFYFFPNGTEMKVLSALGHGDEPAVGTEPEVEFFNLESGGDYFLMVASDGILTLESDDQNAKAISEAIAPGLSNEEVFAGLLARHRGTPMDNLTMYLANVRELIGRSEMRVVQGFDVFVSKETWAAMASWPIVLGNKISLTGFNDFYEVQLIDPSGQPAVLLGVDNQPLKFVLKIYQDGEGTHKLREATEVGVYEKIMQAAIDQPIEGQPGSWIHIPAGLMGGVFRGGDNDSMYEVDPAAGYQGVKAKKGLLMVWVPGIDMEDLLMSETWIESYRKMEIPNQIPNPNFNFSENPLGAYKALASALVETLYRFHKVTGRVHGDIKLDAFKVQYLDEEKGILDISPETGEMAVKLIDYDAAADIWASLAGTKPEEILGTWDFVSHRQVSPATVGGQDFRISAPNFFDDYVSLALMLAYLWMDPADVKTFLQRKQYAGHKELSADYHKRILGRSTRLEFIQERGNLEGNPLKDWILDVLNLRPQLAQAGYSLDEVVRSYFIEVLTRSEMREGETAQPGIIRSSVENHADQLRAATVARILTRRKNLPQAEVLTADRVSGIVTEYEATINAHPYVRKVFDFRGNMEELRAGEQFGGQRRMIAFEGDKQLEFIQVRAVQIMPGDEDAGIINERDFIFIRNPNAAGNPIIGYAIIKEILHPQTSAGALGLNRNLTVAFHLFQGRDQTLLPSSREIYEAVAALGIQAHPQAERLAVNAASQIFHSNFETNENAAVEAQSARAGFYARMGFYSPSRQNLLNRYLFDTSTIDRKFNSKEMNALSAAQDTHWILNLTSRSEMREGGGQVKAPLDLPWNDLSYRESVKRIYVTGEYDIGNGAKLGYDAVRFAFLVPALLKRFPNATIEIEGVDFAQMFEHHKEWSRIKPVSAPKGKYQLAIAQRSLSGKPADLNTDYFLDIVNLAVYGGARSELVDQNGKMILRKEISKTEEVPIFWNEAEAILKDWELIDGESELPLNIYNHPEVGGHQVDWMRLIRTADESDFFDRKISGKPIPLMFKQIMNYQTMNEIVTGKSNVVYVNLDAVTQEQTVNKAFWVQLLSKVLHANPNSHLMFSGGTSPSARSFARSVAEELIAYSSGNQRIFVLPMIDSARLSQVWDFMAIADAVVTPNTGFMHMAHAAGRPLFVVDTSKEFTKHWSSPAERTEMVYLLDIKRIFSHHTALAEQYVAKLFEKTFALKEEYPRQSFQVGFEFTRFAPQFSRMMDSMRQAAERPEISPRERAWIEHYNQLLESGDTVKLGYQDFETHLQAYVTELTRDQNPSQIVVGTYDAQVVTKLIAEIEKKETSSESEAAGKLFLSYMLWHLQQGDSKNGTAFLKPITLSARSESRKLDAFQIKLLSDDWMSSEKNSRVRADAEEKLFAEELNLYVGILFRIINQEIGRQKVKISGTSLEDAIVVFMEANLSRIFPRGLSSRQLDDRKAALVKWMQENNKPTQEVLTVETMGAFDEIIYLALLDYQRMRLEFDHPELNNLGEVYSGQIFHTEKTAAGVFASAPWSVVLKFFIALRALGVQLQGKQMLDFGAGDFRFGIAAANYFSMKADGYEINPSISDKTKELLRRFSGKQTANAAYYSSQDGDGLSDEADWGKYDLITYFYTEPSDPSEREMFRAKFLNKMQTMKPGAHIALLAIRNQIFNGILPLTDYQGSEWTLLNSSPIQLESGYDQPGIYLKVYRFNGRARSELRGVLLPENILDALQRGEEASATAPVIAALVAGGVVFAAGEATMENLHSVAGFIMPARSENRLSSILKLDGWHGDKKSVTIEFTTEQKLEELDIEDMRAILTANPDSRYGFIVKTGEIKSKWLELRSQYPKQFMIEVNDKAALNRGLSRILQGVGLEPIQITGLQQDLNEITILQTAIGSRRDIRLISYKEEDAEPRKHSIRIAQTVVAGQSTDIGDLREVSAELFEEENVNSWRIVSDVLSKIVGEITLQIQAQAKAAVSA